MWTIACLETGSGWSIQVEYVKSVAGTLADGICRWDLSAISSALHAIFSEDSWKQKNTGQAGADICTGGLATGTFVDRFRGRLRERRRRVSGLGPRFASLTRRTGICDGVSWRKSMCGF